MRLEFLFIAIKNGLVSHISKSLWKGENLLVQKFVKDSIGRSIRVLCFDNKAFTVIQSKSHSGDFRSNIDWGDSYVTESLMDNPKFELYKNIAERACRAIGNLIIAGVDLIDSPSEGILVLEINSYPEFFESWESTGICTVKKFAQSFVSKVERSLGLQ